MKKILLLTAANLLLNGLFAQFFQGLRSSPFGGVTNVPYNPAIADNRFVVDVNLLNLAMNMSNNYVGVDRKVLLNQAGSTDNFQDDHLAERINGKNKFAYVGMQAQLPLSFMCSWGKKTNNNAFAFTSHFNTIFNLDHVDETFARIAYYGVGYKAESVLSFLNQSLENKNLSAKAMSWMDYGLTYSRVVYDKGEHFIKVGGTLKLLQGIAGGYVYAKDLKYQWQDFDTLSVFKTDVDYKYSEGFVTSKGFAVDNANNFFHDLFKFKYAAPSFAVDLGVVYEWRPDKERYQYQMDCEDWWRYDQNRYKLAAGFSLVDFGAINFKTGEYSGNFTANIQDWYVKGAEFPDGLQSIDDTIRSKFIVNPSSKKNFTMWLPTRFNLFLDYNIGLGFGVNAATTISPNMAPGRNMVHQVTTFTLTPKYDHAWFGFYLPLSYDVLGNISLGTTLRVGPLIIGTQDLLGLFAKKMVYNADVHIALKVTIPYHKIRDHDKDGVSNKKDECKKEKGNCESHGCPDRDGDGVTDAQDNCPDEPGSAALNGCPDTDGDGVIDREDSCVNDAGLAEFHGCPDRDSDRVIDRLDECPDTPGLPALNGCPDRDNDGVPDHADLCPDVPGSKDHFGCPDTDGDGVYDNDDRCIQVKGPAANAGCPYADTDGDGIADKDDECPKVYGVPENKGCPQLEKKEIETVKYAFENLEFETGKDVIRKHSYASLNALADLLIKKANYGLRIEGHTDNVGSDESNLLLSQKRANAVRNYLVKRGVEGTKLEAFGYGESMPIADNNTPEGRQKNRRVEMKITFK